MVGVLAHVYSNDRLYYTYYEITKALKAAFPLTLPVLAGYLFAKSTFAHVRRQKDMVHYGLH